MDISDKGSQGSHGVEGSGQIQYHKNYTTFAIERTQDVVLNFQESRFRAVILIIGGLEFFNAVLKTIQMFSIS